MTQICNKKNAFAIVDAILNDEVETYVERGSAYFASAFAEVLHAVSDTELHRLGRLSAHLDRTVAFLEGACYEYDQAVSCSERNLDLNPDAESAPLGPALEDVYELGVRANTIPDWAAPWEEMAAAISSGSRTGLLRAFRSELGTCLAQAEAVAHDVYSSDLTAFRRLVTKLCRTLVLGQDGAVAFQLNSTGVTLERN